jgi:Helix-turn-helix domain
MNNPHIPTGTVDVEDILAYLDRDRYLSKSQAAAYTALSLRTLESHREIRRFKVGGKVLYRKSDLDAWILAHEIKAEPAQTQTLHSILKQAKEAVRSKKGGWQEPPSPTHK